MSNTDLFLEIIGLPENERNTLMFETFEEDNIQLTPAWKANFISATNQDKIRLLRYLRGNSNAIMNYVYILEYIHTMEEIDRITGRVSDYIDDITM